METQYRPSSLYVAGTLIVGLGGSGAETVRLIKARVRQSMSPPPQIIDFLAVDTEPRQNEPGREHLSQGEYAYLGDYNARRVLEELDAHPHIKDWWFDTGQVVTGTIHKGARQRRPVGRLSLYVNWGEFARSFDAKAKAIREIAERERAQNKGINVQRTGLVKVYIISSVCGGTGSSIFLDVAFRARQVLGDDADIMGIFYLPSCFLHEVQSVKQRRRIQANAYASLKELNHFLKGTTFEASFPDEPFYDRLKRKVTTKLSRPFDTVYLIDQTNNKEGISDLANIRHMAAQQVFLDILTPMSARFAARRANLQDLAGEKSKAGTKGRDQSLAIAGFSTASLILPSDQMRATAVALFGATTIRDRVIGKPVQGNRILDEQIRLRLDRLRQILRFERVPEGSVSEPEEIDPWDMLFGDDSGQSTGRSIDMSDVTKTLGEAYDGIRNDLCEDFKSHRLYGMEYILAELTRQVTKLLDETRSRERSNQQQIERINRDLAQPRRNAPWYQLGSAKERANQEYAERQASLSSELKRMELEHSRDHQMAETLSRLVNDFRAIAEVVNRHIRMLEEEANRLEATAQGMSRSIATSVPTSQRQRADVFELATYVGGEDYLAVVNGVETNEPYWSWAPRRAAHEAKPNGAALEKFDVETTGLSFGLQVDKGFGTNFSLRLTEMGYVDLKAIADATRVLFDFGTQVDFSIMEYLQWFYKNVRHGPNEARFSPLDPLQKLNERCKAPFLEIDSARLGTEGGNDTEPVRLLGMPEARSTDPSDEDLLDDFDGKGWEDVPTGMRDRIDISYSRHGYPLRVLRDLDVFKKSYVHFIEEGEKLHPHKNWPTGMDDIV